MSDTRDNPVDPRVPVGCAHYGCNQTLHVHQRHVDNVLAAGWRCTAHRAKETTA